MVSKIMQVFYGNDCLPYKDRERTVHYPIVGGAFQGASNTTEIRFYIKELGQPNASWLVVAKLPNGKIGNKLLGVAQRDYDTEDEYYVSLQLNSWFTQAKGDVYISLQGYDGNLSFVLNPDTNLYEISGDPLIQATGSVKLNIMYATQVVGEDTNMIVDVDDILALAGDKLDIINGIVVISNTSAVISGYEDNQIFYCLADNSFYKKVSGALSLIFTAYSKTESDNKYFINASNNTASGNNTFSGQNTFSGRAVFSGNANLYNTYLTTNTKNYFARVGTTTNQYVMYKLPYNYSDLGSQATYTLITKEYTDTQLATKVSKTSDIDKVYGTDGSGNQRTFNVDSDLVSGEDGIVVRRLSPNGQVIVGNPTAVNHATPKGYVDSELLLKADKSNTYTKTEVNNLIDSVKSGELEIVDTTTYPTLNSFLATIGEEGHIYLYPIDISDLTKGYYRYAWENISGTEQWVSLGTTEIDLSAYYTKTETNTLLSGYVGLTNAQTITGAKTFSGNNNFSGENSFIHSGSTNAYKLSVDSNDYAILKYNSTTIISIQDTSGMYIRNSILPNANNTYNLGSSSYKWKDLYLSGNLSDGTNSIAVSNIQEKLVESGENQNIKTINGTSLLGSGDITINSAVWGNITGTLSNQTDLQTELNKIVPQWFGTQEQYDALGTYDSNTVYNILES